MTTVATATVKGGFWPTNGVNSLASMSGASPQRGDIARAFGTKGLLPWREIAYALCGAVAGGTATKTYARVVAAEELGGQRPIETVNLVNRATTAADVAEIQTDFLRYSTRTTFGASPVVNLDRNPLGTR